MAAVTVMIGPNPVSYPQNNLNTDKLQACGGVHKPAAMWRCGAPFKSAYGAADKSAIAAGATSSAVVIAKTLDRVDSLPASSEVLIAM
jgi:hypothetical protein